jgi:hypothetical protein
MVCPGSYPEPAVISLSVIQSGTADAWRRCDLNTANRRYEAKPADSI